MAYYKQRTILYNFVCGQLSAMRTLLTQRVDEGLRNQFGTRTVQEVVSGERDELMNILTTDLNRVAAGELGIEVLDVRVKKIELPTEVNESVYNRMRTERERLAQELRAQGTEIAEGIRANADRERTIILAEAYKRAEELREMGTPKLQVFTLMLTIRIQSFMNSLEV